MRADWCLRRPTSTRIKATKLEPNTISCCDKQVNVFERLERLDAAPWPVTLGNQKIKPGCKITKARLLVSCLGARRAR